MTTSDTGPAELPTGGLLGVFAHPDDETLGAGDLMATVARAGIPVTVVTGTRGERGEVIPADLAHLEGDGPALAEHRRTELARALAALGVTAHVYLDTVPGLADHRPSRFTDSGMAWVRPGLAGPAPDAGPEAFSTLPVDVPARLLAAVLRRSRPGVLVTEEPGGGYGHPDHVQAHRVAMRAVELAADAPPTADDDPLAGLLPWRVPNVAWVVRSEPVMREALRWLSATLADSPQLGARGDVLTPAPADAELPPMVVPPDQVDLTVPTTAVLEPLRDAMLAHRSQVQGVHVEVPREDGEPPHEDGEAAPPAYGWFAVSNGVVQPVLGAATLRVAPGHGSVADLAAALGLPA
ncbi:PIG-L family deacetylase [Georgenia sp. 10Sc9-8]|uniref:PIG-L family deacetylase n=1 Tax=Georgenia halotolerans TaxID=3028317 RepID=A0ABT5TY47_9MICO|nr:PIG-L family deacetylase [Georgenia halotolerans]